MIDYSVVLASRGRPDSLRECLRRAVTGDSEYRTEVLVRVDRDDTASVRVVKEFEMEGVRCYVGPRLGFGWLWLSFRSLFGLARGKVMVPISDDLMLKLGWREMLGPWFEKHWMRCAVLAWYARVMPTARCVNEDEYVRNWGYNSLYGDQDVYKHAKRTGILVRVPKPWGKTDPKDQTKLEGSGGGWVLRDRAKLSEPWKEV